jgi:hypothetical protein
MTHVQPCDTLYIQERGTLKQQFKKLNSELEISFVSARFNIQVRQAFRTKDRYSYSGVGDDGQRYDIVIGRPEQGDAVVSFRKCDHEVIVIDL